MAVLTEEQTILKEQVSNWVRDEASVAQFRKMRDSGAEYGFEPGTWKSICDLGLGGLLIPEAYGGSGMDFRTLGVVLEELGRGLTASPLVASSVVGASAIMLGGNEEQKRQWLPRIASGEVVATLAVDEKPHHAPSGTALIASQGGESFRLEGKKCFVPEGIAADLFIVATRTSGQAGERGGITIILVDGNASGIERTQLCLVDHRGHADIEFSDVVVSERDILGSVDQGFELLDQMLDRGRAALSAEMLGIGAEAFDRTLEYLKTREQFGQVIGSFQALGHRAATHFMDMEFARSSVEGALEGIDLENEDSSKLCSLAKYQVGDFLHSMTNDMIQMHGGIGVTDEFDAGFFLKRARVAEATFGNRAFHLDRYISSEGI